MSENDNNKVGEVAREEAEQDKIENVEVNAKKKGRVNFANKYVLLITKTAAIMAVTLALQYVAHFAFSGVGSVVFVGTIVNMCLYVAALSVGLIGGAVVSMVTPVVAFLTGHMGFPPLIPFIGIANYILVLTVHFTFKIKNKNNWFILILAILLAGVLKFMAMYFGVLNVAKALSAIKPPQIAVLQVNFSWPQFVTAVSGGALAVPVLFGLKKARIVGR